MEAKYIFQLSNRECALLITYKTISYKKNFETILRGGKQFTSTGCVGFIENIPGIY